MAVVQGLIHLLTVALGRTLKKMNMAPEPAIAVSTPIFRASLDFIGRLLGQDLELYADLIGKNRYVGEALDAFMESVEEGRMSLLNQNKGEGVFYLETLRDFFGEFCKKGLIESDMMLNQLYRSI